jgi:membrane protein DedA with SNARE-associated domain
MSAHHAWMISAVTTSGPPLLFLALTLETLGLPIPGETLLLAAAAAAGAGDLSIFQVVVAGIAGAVLGDNIGYLLGRRFGRRLVLAKGSRVGITEARYQSVERQFDRFGVWVVGAARFFVLLRQLNGLVAGTAGMPWPRFLLANIVGACLWVGFWSLVAYRLGGSADILPAVWHRLAPFAALLVPVAIVALLVFRFRQDRHAH